MLRTLCREMELHAPLFVEESDVALPEDFDWEGVQPFTMPANSTASYMNLCPAAYGGTLSLPGSGFGDLVISQFASPPAVFYVSSGSFDLQSTLDKYFALRDCDRLCVDAWWIKERLSTLVPNPDKIAVVPTGVDSEFFQPMDTGGCKTELASAFRNESIKDLPLVLLFLPTLSRESRAFVEKLAGLNPQMFFMVVLCQASEGREWGLENIEVFPIADLADYNSLPILFNAAALGFFPAKSGNQLHPLQNALCCGVPVIVSGPESLKTTMPALGTYLSVEGNQTVDETVGALSELMRKLLKDTDELRGLRKRSREIGVTFGWAEMAKSVRELFTDLTVERSDSPANPMSPVGFYQYHYDIVTGAVTPSAYERTSGTPREIDELITTDLLAGATSEGVQQVVEFLATDSSTTKKR
ncbi:MAG: glycosyltransferase [Candidatus Poribacteria bacterium]|nr:glycosyltransferase [Candidatus Poribacteria bacterium]